MFALACSGVLVAACDGKRGQMEEATFRVESVSLEKTTVKKTDNFGLPQTKEFAFKACITDAESRGAISISRFTVSDGTQGRSVLTDSGGCLEWKEIHTFSSLQKEQTMRMDRTFISEETYTGSVTVSLAFNPWVDTLVDLRKSSDPDLEPQSPAMVGFDMNLQKDPIGVDPFSEAAMDDVKLDFNGHDMHNTEVTSLLTLKPAQRFRLSLKPQFLRRNVRNEVTYLDLKGGEFRVRLIVLADNGVMVPSASDIVAYSESTIEVQPKGLAQKDITVRIHDVAAVLSRNRFYLIMQPIGAAVAMARPAVYQGFVGPLAGNDASVDVIPFDGDDTSFILSVDNAISKLHTKVSAMDLFEQVSGLKPEVGSTALLSMVESAPTAERAPGLLRDFCAKLYNPSETTTITVRSGILNRERQQTVKVLDACLENPAKFLRLDRRDIVQEVLGKPHYMFASTKTISLNRDLKYVKVQATGEKRDHTTGYGWGGSAGFDILGLITKFVPVVGQVISAIPGLNLGLGLKANIGTDWLNSEGLAKTEEVGIGAAISESEQFKVATVGYELKVKVRSCALLAAAHGPVRGFYACSQAVKERSTTETYYQVNHSVENSVFADALSAGSTMWRVMVRGQENYSAFEHLMTKGSGVLQFSTLKIENPKAALLPDFKINQAFPGVISAK